MKHFFSKSIFYYFLFFHFNFTCKCSRFLPRNDQFLCYIDHDECLGNVHGCEQQCLNVPGGYNCTCFAGYRLNAEDFTTCDGIVFTKNGIKNLSVTFKYYLQHQRPCWIYKLKNESCTYLIQHRCECCKWLKKFSKFIDLFAK